ncbi:MAG: hypothetical protein JWO03_823 [Bacteroidetes bacterium]|nr:hypothetical protein [Bacteroidota bacterium]
MHFLSHYYVDRHLDNPYIVLGALLPDISPGFTRTYNGVIRKREWSLEGDIGLIHKGVLRHYEVDASFHGSLVFREACSDALKMMIEAGLDRDKYRLSFLAHIAVEVMLDRQLIVQNSSLINVYYKLLESIQINNFSKYLSQIMPDEQKERTIVAFRRFLEIKFLKYLDKVEGAAEGIMRTAHRATGVDFPTEDKAKLIVALHNIDNEMRYSWNKLLEIN